MDIEKSTVNLGKIKLEGTTVAFKIYNTGEAPLFIDRVNADCKCTVPILIKKVILPGDSSNIQVRFKPTMPGPIMQTISVYSKGSSEPKVLVLRAIVN